MGDTAPGQGRRRVVARSGFRARTGPAVGWSDAAGDTQFARKRNESGTGPQALALLKHEVVLGHSKALAAWLEKQTPDREKQIVLACERVWGRPPPSWG